MKAIHIVRGAAVACLLSYFLVVFPGFASAQGSTTDIESLAHRFVATLHLQSGSVIVVDFAGPDRDFSAFGAWLADRFSVGLAVTDPELEVIDRVRLKGALDAQNLSPKDELSYEKASVLGESVGAGYLIMGSFGALGSDIGITLNAFYISRNPTDDNIPPRKLLSTLNAKMPETAEIAAQLDAPIDSLRPKDGIFTGGLGGISTPQCIYCPSPKFHGSGEKKGDGRVILDVIWSPQGVPTQIKLLNSFDAAIDEQVIETVQGWKLKPSTDPDGSPVSVHQKVMVTFHLY